MEFEAIGTHWSIALLETPDGWDDVRAKMLAAEIHARIEEFDKAYSRFRADSLVSSMAQKAGVYELPHDAKPLLDTYEELYRATNGKFTPLVGQLISDAGYDANYSLTPRELSDVKAWDDVLEYKFPKLTLREPALLDFGAAGKGYLVDIVVELIEKSGVSAYVVNAGGDIRVKASLKDGARKIGLEDPVDTSKVLGVVEISSGSLCGSAGNRRAWDQQGRKYHHIFDPDARDSARDIQAVWVTAPTALYADAIATCLFLVPPEVLAYQQKKCNFEYLIISATRTFQKSAGFPAELFIV